MGNQQLSTFEIYKQHPLYPRLEVSNFGNVRDTKSGNPRYTKDNAQGYLYLQVRVDSKRVTLKIHRLVAELFLPEPSAELLVKCAGEHWGKVLVKHKDNNKHNNHFSNLEWSDLLGNTRQAWFDGLIESKIGEANGRAVLNEAIVRNLCIAFEYGMTPKKAVEVFGVSRQQATKIRAGFAWKHIWCEYDIKVNRRGKSSTTSREA